MRSTPTQSIVALASACFNCRRSCGEMPRVRGITPLPHVEYFLDPRKQTTCRRPVLSNLTNRHILLIANWPRTPREPCPAMHVETRADAGDSNAQAGAAFR